MKTLIKITKFLIPFLIPFFRIVLFTFPLFTGELLLFLWSRGSWRALLYSAALSSFLFISTITVNIFILPLFFLFIRFFSDIKGHYLEFINGDEIISEIERELEHPLQWKKIPIGFILKRTIKFIVLTDDSYLPNSLPSSLTSLKSGPVTGIIYLPFLPSEATNLQKYQILHELGHFVPSITRILSKFPQKILLLTFIGYTTIALFRGYSNHYSQIIAGIALAISAMLFYMNFRVTAQTYIDDEITADAFGLQNSNIEWFASHPAEKLAQALCKVTTTYNDASLLNKRVNSFVNILNHRRGILANEPKDNVAPKLNHFETYGIDILSAVLIFSVISAGSPSEEILFIYALLALLTIIIYVTLDNLHCWFREFESLVCGKEYLKHNIQEFRNTNRHTLSQINSKQRISFIKKYRYIYQSLYVACHFKKLAAQTNNDTPRNRYLPLSFDRSVWLVYFSHNGSLPENACEFLFHPYRLILEVRCADGRVMNLGKVSWKVSAHIDAAQSICIHSDNNCTKNISLPLIVIENTLSSDDQVIQQSINNKSPSSHIATS